MRSFGILPLNVLLWCLINVLASLGPRALGAVAIVASVGLFGPSLRAEKMVQEDAQRPDTTMAAPKGPRPNRSQPTRVIGATAKLTEKASGYEYPARIDTGAATCSLHVEQVEIENPSARRKENVGKKARILLRNNAGETKWVETVIAASVRVKSSTLESGEYDRRYKVRLTLCWKDFSKEVMVTLNDRADMEYPMLIGRNFLEGDFLVDVSLDRGQE